jgi:hypothetical protein
MAPYNMAKWCYDNVAGETKEVKSYTYDKHGTTFLDEGAWRKFNQQEFAASYRLEIPNIREWGFYYVPNNC